MTFDVNNNQIFMKNTNVIEFCQWLIIIPEMW